jgi:hypothetical protein
MSYYLFRDQVERAQAAVGGPGKNATVDYVKQLCVATTATLTTGHGRDTNREDDRTAAGGLIDQMGSKVKGTAAHHAQDHVDNWRQVSDNCGVIRDMVHAEWYAAYQWGLDTRAHEVVGKMYALACLVWSELGDYTSATQDGLRR